MISALNVSGAQADNILGFLAVLEAAKDPAQVKAFFAELQAHRERIANAEIAASQAAAVARSAQAEAQSVIDSVGEAQRFKDEVQATIEQENQKLSDARADVERAAQENKAARALWLDEVAAKELALDKRAINIQALEDKLAKAQAALAGDQAAVDRRAADVELLQTQWEAKLKALRDAVGGGDEVTQ